jgi:4-amino-4-deoxy-L-arabinose transferase-like glycosyltransferase
MSPITRRIWMAIGLITLARLIFAGLIPLTEDEAYYRLWSQHLALGYFDHPPLVAWAIRLGTSLLGDHALGIRLSAVLASGATSLILFDLAKRLGLNETTAERAALWYSATLMIAAGAILSTPDAFATLFWVTSLWCLAAVFEPGREHQAARWWCLAGGAAGLATLSKYSSLFIAPGVLLWVLTSAQRRKSLATPWPWAAALIGAGLFGINVWWNSQNEWLTFAKQFGRVEPAGFAPKFLIELLLTQGLLLNPLITGFAVRGLWMKAVPTEALAEGRKADLSLLILTALPFGLYLMIHALHDRVQGHWPTPLYPALALMAAVAAARVASNGFTAFVRRAVLPLGLGLGCAVLIFGAFTDHRAGFKGDPTRSLRQWPTFAVQVEEARRAQGANWVGTFSYVTLAQLSNQPASLAPLIQLTERDRYAKAPLPKGLDTARPGLVVDLDRRISQADLSTCFAMVQRLPDLHRGGEGPGAVTYGVYYVEGPRHDLTAKGCWSAKTLVDSLERDAKRASGK